MKRAKKIWRSIRRFSRKIERSRLSWWIYSRLVILSARRRQADPEYERTGLKTGRLEPHLTERLVECFEEGSLKPITVGDFLPGYKTNPNIEHIQSEMNSSFGYIGIENKHLDILEEACLHLRDEIESCLGTGWRIVNARAWSSHPETVEIGPNDWHSDGFADGLYKLLIYFTKVGRVHGTTEVKLRCGGVAAIEGGAGNYAFFNSTELEHRGIAPQKGRRGVIELTVAAAVESDSRPVFAGQNAMYPIYPWSRA